MTSAVAIAQALIRHASVTPSDAGALGTLRGIVERAGFTTSLVTFTEPGTPDIDNLYARIGVGAPYLLFAGHTDVVPPGDVLKWRHDPFAATIENDVLYGRGAQDMKSGIAAFVAAAIAHTAEGGLQRGSIGLLITGDEEGPAVNGTVKLLNWAHERGERFDHCIVGEPTSRDKLCDMIKVGRRGSLNGWINVHGRQGHVAYPAKAENPIPPLIRIVSALLQRLDDGSDNFDSSNLEIISIDVGNEATNVIPAEATAAFNVRFNDRWTADTLANELRSRVEVAAQGVHASLDFEPSNAPSFLTPLSPFTELIRDAVEAELGWRPQLSTSGGTSDARFVQNYCPVVELGLVGDTMHMTDERVPVADVERLSMIYRRIIAAYLAAY